MTQTTTQEHFTLPPAQYVLGCPRLILGDAFDDAFYEPGLGEYKGHKFFTVSTGGDGSFHLFDMEEFDEPVNVDTFMTDVARISIIPFALIPFQSEAFNYGRELSLETDEGLEPWEITVNRDEKGNVRDVDIEFYKLIVDRFTHPDPRFKGDN